MSRPNRILTSLSLGRFLLVLCVFLCAGRAYAIDYSVPFLRGGLPYFYPDGDVDIAGLDAIVGEVEVRGSEGNGIDGFPGHTQSALAPAPGSAGYGEYGFQNVEDFSGKNDPIGRLISTALS